jgi:tetratricopeptide (TPR) repeat protein
MKTQTFSFSFILLAIIVSSCQQPQSHITEYNETIVTYPFSDTNPLPIIPKRNDIYPYSRIDGYSYKGESREWKMIKIENEYVEIYILPEMGGKLWGAVDKKTGKEFIYMNDAIKFRDVAMRGPWTSGGIEWNSGVIGHHPGGAAPVDYKLFTDEDGTAHCVVGGMDLPSHLQWRVDISLPVNTSYFETKTIWYNATPFSQSYYHWNNAAVKSAKDLHFYFPGNYRLGHDGLPQPWPVDKEGIDRSWYKNNTDNNSSSYHIFGSLDNYFVSFYEDENFGSGHWSRSYGAPGKKIWLWSQARNGAIWKDLLTDKHGQYVEVQAGRMFNQNSVSSGHTPFKQPSFIPYNTDSWTERWFPVRATGGVTRVAESGTIHVKFSDDGMNLLFSPIREINKKMKVIVNGEKVSDKYVVLKPSETLNESFSDILKNDNIEIFLEKEKLYSTKDQYIINRPVKAPFDALDDLFVQATELENRRYYQKALDKYLEILDEEPMYLNALVRVANIYARRYEYEQANHYARKALEINAYSPEANFIYGYIQKVQGNLIDAEDGFRWAMRSLEYRSASLELIAEISLMEGKTELASSQAKESLLSNMLNLNSYKVQAIAERKLKHNKQAEKILNKLLEIDPLSHFVWFEKYLLQPNDEVLKVFNNSFENEILKEEYLELGIFYAGIGLRDEAVKVLEEAPSYPVINYWLAWLNSEEKGESQTFLEKALESNPEFVFPYRNETLPVLAWASKQYPSWKTDYYSALILWHNDRGDEALKYLVKWDNKPEFVPFYYTRANLRDISSSAALMDMERALAIGPDQWRTYNELANIYNRHGDFKSALDLLEKAHSKFPGNYILDISYGRSLTLTGNYKKSLEVLSKTNVLPYEGENSAHNIFEYNYLKLAYNSYKDGKFEMAMDYIDKSEAYPENLGSGSPSYPDYRNQNKLRILIYTKTGETRKLKKSEKYIKEYTRKFGKQKGGNIFEHGFIDSSSKPF